MNGVFVLRMLLRCHFFLFRHLGRFDGLLAQFLILDLSFDSLGVVSRDRALGLISVIDPSSLSDTFQLSYGGVGLVCGC